MATRSLSVLLCHLLVVCIVPPREPAERSVNVEDSARWDAPATAIRTGAGGAVQSVVPGGSGAESVSSSGSGGFSGSSKQPGFWHPANTGPLEGRHRKLRAQCAHGQSHSAQYSAVPFAQYLIGMHKRIHPIFADVFLVSLDAPCLQRIR